MASKNRLHLLNNHLTEVEPIFDILIIGGGAIGLGIAFAVMLK